MFAVCTPLMRRVHSMWSRSGELCCVDSSGTMDRHSYRVFLLLTHSQVGGLPLGALIIPFEDEATIKAALKMLFAILPEDAWNGRGSKGPISFMTDDCTAETKAISSLFPHANMLLCSFHILQAAWRWLWNSKHLIPKKHRPSLFNAISRMVKAPNQRQCEAALLKAEEAAYGPSWHAPLMLLYPQYLNYVGQLWDRMKSGPCFGEKMLL